MLVLGDAQDALSLVRNAIADWKLASGSHLGGNPAGRTIDLDDLAGELTIVLWSLYSVWEPDRLTFTSYATGLLPRRIASYVRDAVGGEAFYRRNGRGSLYRVWPKAHATSVCSSIEGLESARDIDGADGTLGGTGGPVNDRSGGRNRLAGSVGAVTTNFADNRSPDLGRILARRGR